MRAHVRGTPCRKIRGSPFSSPSSLLASASSLPGCPLYAFDVGTHASRSSDDSCFMPSYSGDVGVSFASRRKKPASLMSVANSNSLIFKRANVRDPWLIRIFLYTLLPITLSDKFAYPCSICLIWNFLNIEMNIEY